ncbi:MAG: T9SS type A sorting domain-containing protein, partial [Bacteroidetes bacterium]|nr:T9SS type A sorting domain-containing protein [Bacteroidota bacterium]
NDNVNALATVSEEASVQKPISFSVYPNPVQNELYLTSTDVEGFDKASVYSLQGKLIRQVQVTEGATIIDVSSMPAGSYIIILQNSNGSKLKSGKFIIQH